MAMSQRALFGDPGVVSAGGSEGVEDKDPVKKMRIAEIRRREKGIPIECDCGVAIAIVTSESPRSKGERVFRCGYDVYDYCREGCGFRKSWEDALLEEFEKIRDEKNELQERLDEATSRIENQEGRLYEMQMQYEEMMADRKQVEDYDGELGETQIGLAEMRDNHSALKERVEVLEKQRETVKKNL